MISRRGFMKYCVTASAVLGLGPLDLLRIQSALANPAGKKVIWLQGSGCSGCSISFLNRVSETAPVSAAAVLTETVDLLYHPTLMAASGSQAADIVRNAMAAGGHVLVVEGGVPTGKLTGAACMPWATPDGDPVMFDVAVKAAAANAAQIICVGACASFGGVSAAGENPGGVVPVSKVVTGKPLWNIPGCPPHPDWMVWAIAQAIAGNAVELDALGRPTGIYGLQVHAECPRNTEKNPSLKKASMHGVDHLCLEQLGCRGPKTMAPCPSMQWNNGANWCVDANGNCVGCTEPIFPGTADFHVTI